MVICSPFRTQVYLVNFICSSGVRDKLCTWFIFLGFDFEPQNEVMYTEIILFFSSNLVNLIAGPIVCMSFDYNKMAPRQKWCHMLLVFIRSGLYHNKMAWIPKITPFSSYNGLHKYGCCTQMIKTPDDTWTRKTALSSSAWGPACWASLCKCTKQHPLFGFYGCFF